MSAIDYWICILICRWYEVYRYIGGQGWKSKLSWQAAEIIRKMIGQNLKKQYKVIFLWQEGSIFCRCITSWAFHAVATNSGWNMELEVKCWTDLSISLCDDEILLSPVVAPYFQNDAGQLEENTNSDQRARQHNIWGRMNRTKVITLKKRSLGVGWTNLRSLFPRQRD